MFQTKDFVSIVASMVNLMRSTQKRITDFNVGSVARTLVEAPAAEIDEFYQQMFFGLKEAIPVSVYNSFDFEAIDAVPASGLIRVSITASTSDTLISAGSTFSPSGGIDYTSSQDVVIAAGETFGDVLATATQAGTVGNIGAGQSFTINPTLEGFVAAQNLSPFMNGINAETPDDRKLRFNAFVQSLNRGTVAALEYGLKTTQLLDAGGNLIERVVAVSVYEPWKDDPNQPISLVKCYVHNGVGATSSALVNRAREVTYGYYDDLGTAVPGWKAAGVKVEVYAATEQSVAVTGVLTALPGYDKPTLVSSATQAVFAYIQGLDIGAEAVLSEIIRLIKDLEGVYDFVPSAPLANVAADKTTKLMPGAITIT